MTFCKALQVIVFLFAITLHVKTAISLQSVIGHRIKSSLCIKAKGGNSPGKIKAAA
jgi:hypothetical protein